MREHGYVICTAWSLNEQRGYWGTAAHCMGDEPLTINGEPVTPIYVNHRLDIAVLRGPREEAIPLGRQSPKGGETITLLGFPNGWNVFVVERGIVHYAHAWLSPRHPRMIMKLEARHGHSGSPILNDRGEVVSILQGGWEKSAFNYGITTTDLFRVLSHFVE